MTPIKIEILAANNGWLIHVFHDSGDGKIVTEVQVAETQSSAARFLARTLPKLENSPLAE